MGERDQGDLIVAQPTDLVKAPAENEIERLRAEIEASRERVRHSIEDLQDEIEETFDWRAWVREHPWQTVGAAFAIGFLWGSG